MIGLSLGLGIGAGAGAGIGGRALATIRPSTLTAARTKAAAVRAGSGMLRLLVLGDSNVAGAGGGTSGSYLYTGARARNFASRLASPRWSFAQGSIVGAQKVNAQNSYLTFDPRITWTNGQIFAANCLGGDCITTPNGGTATIIFNPEKSFDRVEIIYLSNPGNSTATITANGEAVATIDAATTLGVRSSGVIALTQARSALTFSVSAGAGFPILGIMTWRATEPAILVLQAGWAGGTIADVNGTSTVYSSGNMIGAFAPDLVIVNGLTINDSSASTSAAAWEASMRSLITKIQATGASLAWMTGLNLGLAAGNSPANDIVLNARIRTVCAELGISVLEMHDLWQPASAYVDQYYTYDYRHPSYLGYTTYAYEVSRYIDKILL